MLAWKLSGAPASSPPADDVRQYRTKSETGRHLRAAEESELSALNRRSPFPAHGRLGRGRRRTSGLAERCLIDCGRSHINKPS
jgi:hypothetical protein